LSSSCFGGGDGATPESGGEGLGSTGEEGFEVETEAGGRSQGPGPPWAVPPFISGHTTLLGVLVKVLLGWETMRWYD